MESFTIEHRGHQLILYRSSQGRLHSVGCIHFGIALCSVAVLGLLGLLWEAESGTDHTALNAQQLFSPHGNHFGFLWLVSMAIFLTIVPFYTARAYRAGTRIVFDLLTGTISVNGRLITTIARLEGVVVRTTRDPAGAPLHRVVLLHNDGAEWVMQTSYNKAEISALAQTVAKFLGLERRNRLV